MKIVFLCGSLEPGRDGVGDYTRRLAGALIRQGYEALIVSLNDPFVQTDIQEAQGVDETDVSVLRLPSLWPLNTRLHHSNKWIKTSDPSWLSLQFVPFSFHSRGLPFEMIRFFAEVGKGRRWHVMFHELWVGMDRQSSLKMILWGNLQKQIIKSLMARLVPEVIHTQTLLYQAQLSHVNARAGYLPLFSNIPHVNKPERGRGEAGPVLKKGSRVSFVVFGAIRPNVPISWFAKEAALYSKKTGLTVDLIVIGRSGPELQHWEKVWTSEGLEIKVLGEQSPCSISEVLKKATVGISTTPITLVGKSGAVAAMLEHGLPVICVTNPWVIRGNIKVKSPDGVQEFQKGNLEFCLNSLKTVHPEFNVSSIARQFALALSREMKVTEAS
ncbi:hypothetical protein V9K67_05770 [Paraflavisolibacter sp. H34]|uniref:hypothetical protein n=1 Tax=Huijunlia imazamoxiresistens TaxID=3127457 RepID=UPI003017514A